MGKADLHIHTAYSKDGTATVAAVLAHVARHTDLDVIAITDHDEIDGALEALELAPRYGIEVIPGCEVTTAEGHLLALYITEPVPAQLSLVETIAYVTQLGGLCVAAHPGGRWPWCLQEHHLRHALQTPNLADTLVGLEAYNASLPNLGVNRQAAIMQQQLGLAQVACSDAHVLSMIGQGATAFPGKSAQDLRKALQERLTTAQICPRPYTFFANYGWRQLLRTLGYVQAAPKAPGSQIVLRRLYAAMHYA
ncbi:MAG: PHP domain-containing protein [Caldilineaceae bacterium]|nr:PHP domain-containing protein [Caldilineaceae bacterium]